MSFVLAKLNFDFTAQIYRPFLSCGGDCSNNYNGNWYCYANPGFAQNKLSVQVGIDLPFYSYFKTVWEKKSAAPVCQAPPPTAPICTNKVVGYFTSWGTKDLSSKQAALFSHINFAFMEMKSNGQVIVGVPGKSLGSLI